MKYSTGILALAALAQAVPTVLPKDVQGRGKVVTALAARNAWPAVEPDENNKRNAWPAVKPEENNKRNAWPAVEPDENNKRNAWPAVEPEETTN